MILISSHRCMLDTMGRINQQEPLRRLNRQFDSVQRPCARGLDVRCLTPEDISRAYRLTVANLPGSRTPIEVVRAVHLRNPANFVGFFRDQELVGIYAMLMLNSAGLEQLLLGELDIETPPTELLASAGEAPACIYTWMVVAPGSVAAGMSRLSYLLQQDPYRFANLYARPATPAGLRMMENFGYRPVSAGMPDLHRYVRIANRSLYLECAA